MSFWEADIESMVILAVLSGALVYYGIRHFKQWLLIKDIPRSKVRSIAMGLVEVHGKPRIQEKIKAPLTGEDCVFYDYKIQEYRKHGKSGSWRTIYSKRSDKPFYIQDETGAIPIIPEGLSVEMKAKQTFYGTGKLLGNLKEDFTKITMDDVKTTRIGFTMGRRRRFTLQVLKEDMDFLIMGTAKAASTGPFLAKGENEKTFLLADGKEGNILKRLRNKWVLFGGGGVALTIFTAILIIMNT